LERHPLVKNVHTKRFTAKARHQYAVIGEHLSFEGLISDLMARFVRTPNTQSDLEIEDAIRRVCLFLGLDQGLIVQWPREGAPMPTHSWTAEGGLPPPVLPGTEVMPWVHSQSVLGNIVMFSRVEDLPAEAARDKEFFRASGRKSLISLPLKIGGSVIGVLVFASLHAEIPWPDEVALRLELIGDFFAGILDRKNRELELEKRLRFEHLLFDLSARFVNIAPDKVEEEIEQSLKRILEFFEVDRCGLLEASPNRKSYQVALVAYAKGIPPVPEKTDLPFSLFPWAASRILDQHEIVYMKSTDDLPPEADVDRQSYQAFGIKSCMTIPILAGDSVTYVLSIDAVSEIGAWPEDYGPRLRLLGEVFVNALERRRVNEALQVSKERLSLAADSSGAYLWHLESDSGHVWITDKGREFFGLTSDNEMDFERFMNVVHSEDREKLRKTVEETMRSGKDNSAEYRIVQPDGSTRWVLSRGRPYQAAEGKPARLMGVSIDITERKKAEEALKESYTAIAMLKEQLAAENIYLRGETNMPREFEDVIGESDALKYVFFRVQQVAATDTTVLITGETGTGKGLVPRSLHRLS
jgi:PAS domain S-box-containing protein